MGGEFSRPHWKDISSWSKGDKDRTPKAWEVRIGDHFRLCVHRHMAFPPDVWCMTLTPVDSNPKELAAREISQAKIEALIKTERVFRQALERLEAVYG